MEYFPHDKYVNDVIKELKLTREEVSTIKRQYQSYANNIYAIPVTIWAKPTPYSSLRINKNTGILYVPNKAKLVTEIRTLILEQIGMSGISTGFFPRFSESIVHTSMYIKTPASYSRTHTFLAESKTLRPIVTPDVDNVIKIVNDSVKAFLIYDDAQIVTAITDKYYSRNPRIEIVIFYNGSPILKAHEKIMEQRRTKWFRQVNSERPPSIITLLRKLYKK